jgi:phytol kinase
MIVMRMASTASVIGLVPALTGVVSVVVRRGIWSAEVGRKFLHLALGAAALSLPWTVGSARGVVVGGLIATLWFLAVRHVPTLSKHMGPAIHAVARTTRGEFYFVAGVALTYVVARGDPLLYCLPIAVLVFADSAAALVGSRVQRDCYRLGTSGKTWPGTGTFFAVALVVALIAVTAFRVRLPLPNTALAFLIAADATLLELCGRNGADNLLIPLGVFALLLGLDWSTAGTLAVHAVAVALLTPGLARRLAVGLQP